MLCFYTPLSFKERKSLSPFHGDRTQESQLIIEPELQLTVQFISYYITYLCNGWKYAAAPCDYHDTVWTIECMPNWRRCTYEIVLAPVLTAYRKKTRKLFSKRPKSFGNILPYFLQACDLTVMMFLFTKLGMKYS